MSSADTEYDFSEPWPIFADEDEPWKDRERLFRLLDKMETQAEVGDALGCDPSTVSYWKRKYEDEVRREVTDEDLECEYHSVCGNEVPGPNNGLCDLCLDLARKAQADDLGWNADDPAVRMDRLYSEYRDYVTEFREKERQRRADDDAVTCEECDEEMVQVGEINAYLCTECGATA